MRWFVSFAELSCMYWQTVYMYIKKVKKRKLLVEFHLTATGRHLAYGITQCYLPPDTSERAPPLYCKDCFPTYYKKSKSQTSQQLDTKQSHNIKHYGELINN